MSFKFARLAHVVIENVQYVKIYVSNCVSCVSRQKVNNVFNIGSEELIHQADVRTQQTQNVFITFVQRWADVVQML